MTEWQIQCGEHSGTIAAPTIGQAWRELTKNKHDGFAPLVRFVRCYSASPWQYTTPEAMDKMP